MRILKFVLALVVLGGLLSCEKEHENLITIGESEKELNFGDKYQIDATSPLALTYTSEDEYHAIVDEDGLVTATFVGETNIFVSNSEDTKKVRIIVESEYNLYDDPDFEFGINRSALISKYGTPDNSSESIIAYYDYSYASPMLLYMFDDNDKLEGVSVVVETLYSSILGSFLVERYFPVDVEELLFMNALTIDDATMAVCAELYNTTYWMVIYIPTTDLKSVSLRSKSIQEKAQFPFDKYESIKEKIISFTGK